MLRPLNAKQASRAPSDNLDDVKFIARRNQHGFKAGDVTEDVMKLQITRVQKFIMHGILTLDPPSNFTRWGKDVAPWLIKNHLQHPVFMHELSRIQKAMVDDNTDGIPVDPAWVKKLADDEAEAKQAEKDRQEEEATRQTHAKEEEERLARWKRMEEEGEDGDEEEEEPSQEAPPPTDDPASTEPIEPVTKPRRKKNAK